MPRSLGAVLLLLLVTGDSSPQEQESTLAGWTIEESSLSEGGCWCQSPFCDAEAEDADAALNLLARRVTHLQLQAQQPEPRSALLRALGDAPSARVLASRFAAGTRDSKCFGLLRRQYVPFWCAVAAVVLAVAALQRSLQQGGLGLGLATAKAVMAGGARSGKWQQRPAALDVVSWCIGLWRGFFASGGSCQDAILEDNIADGDVIRVASQPMATVCSQRGATHGLEAASLAVLLALQRRRSYGTVAAAVRRKCGQLQEISEELLLPKMSFTEFLLAVDRSLQDMAAQKLSAPGEVETLELIFAWDQESSDVATPGLWTMRPASPEHIVVSGSTRAAEESFQVLFAACAENPDGNLWEMPVMRKTSTQLMLAWGVPTKAFASYRDSSSQRLVPVPQLLGSAPPHPEADAVAGDGFCLSYEMLFRRADLVHRAVLAVAGHCHPRRAVLYLPRGEAIAPAFLGVLQAGFQAVPMDVHWPGDRVAAVAEDSEAAVVLVEPSSAPAWHPLGLKLRVVLVDEALFRSGQHDSQPVARASLDQDDPAIMLFTSGSTGKPKGISLSHGYLTALAAGVGEWKRMSPKTRTLCYHSPAWMPFLDYLFAPLLKGGCCLYLPDNGTHVVKPTELSAFASRHGATNAGFVPAMLDVLLESGLPRSLADIGVGGAAVPSELCHRALVALPEDGILYTGYSGTEQGDVTALQMRTPEDVERAATGKGFMGAGKPHSGQRLAILDEGFELVGPGALGEVCVAGPGLASGYLKLPEQAAETFLPSCAALGGARTARSGDLATWAEGGILQVVGRRDSMVKVRGARVELGEVETALMSHPAIKAAVVTVYEDQLVAYVAPAVPANLRDHCKGRLVAYMVPHLFEGLEVIPRLPNGKVDKKALPKPAVRSDGAETVMELDSLGQMRKFTRMAVSEDRVLDNVRAILIGVIIQSHAIPLLHAGPEMLDVRWHHLGDTWGPVQYFILHLIRGGGWSSLALLNGFDDTRAMRPYGLTYREPLFLILWLALGFHWSMWYLPAFVLMRTAFCAAHWMGLERTHIFLASQAWILLPAFVDLYIGWEPRSPKIPEDCPAVCFCPWKVWPQAQHIARYTLGWWVDWDDPVGNSMLGHGLIFIPCYWIGFYWGGGIFKVLTRIADEPSVLRRAAVATGIFALYLAMHVLGLRLIQGYDDRSSSFWGPHGGFLYQRVLSNVAYYAMNLTMSLTYVVFIAAAVPLHLRYLAKICFSSLICSAFTPCVIDLSTMALHLRRVLPDTISPAAELAWVFTVPFLYELAVGAVFAAVLPLVAAAVARLTEGVAGAFGRVQP